MTWWTVSSRQACNVEHPLSTTLKSSTSSPTTSSKVTRWLAYPAASEAASSASVRARRRLRVGTSKPASDVPSARCTSAGLVTASRHITSEKQFLEDMRKKSVKKRTILSDDLCKNTSRLLELNVP